MATKEDVLAALDAVKGPDGAPLPQTGKLSDVVVSDGKVFFSITVDAASFRNGSRYARRPKPRCARCRA